ncbi:MAG: hypothetical protein LBH00_08005 [Planctomycetaceae bacterium]|jgi:hypothetical protein|nr:hypothetical protein [Planctomycetaceae bacterium]
MKKIVSLVIIGLLAASAGSGCTSSGSSWCRSGSLFPIARSKPVQTVYTTSVSAASECNPCEPAACAPCEPAACAPCEPVCDPCAANCTGVITPRGVVPVPGPSPH